MHPQLPSPDNPSAADRAYQHVKAGILDGRYDGGMLLTEGEVASEVEVSRTPVREAFLRLEVEGLIRLYPKKGALVVPISSSEADAILEARAVIEGWATPLAFANRAAVIPDLRVLLDAMTGHRDRHEVAGFTDVDRSFHERIVAAAGNDVMARFYRSLRERQVCINAAAMRVDAVRMDVAIADHTGLVGALEAGDQAAFQALTDDHLQRAVGHARGLR